MMNDPHDPNRTVDEPSTPVGNKPRVALPEGSASTKSTRCPRSAKAAPRLIAVVLLPTPPLALVTATLRMASPPEAAGAGRNGRAPQHATSTLPCATSRRGFDRRHRLIIGPPSVSC